MTTVNIFIMLPHVGEIGVGGGGGGAVRADSRAINTRASLTTG